MKKTLIAVATLCVLGTAAVDANKQASETSPAEDLKVYQEYFMKRFPGVAMQDFANGAYALDEAQRQNWLAIEEFPPYEPMIEAGEAIWNKPFANGKGFSTCFSEGPAQRKNFPYWDAKRKMVVTLPLAINECLEANGEKPLKYEKGDINSLLSYIAYNSRGQITNVEIPDDDPRALAAYEDGKNFYFARRGQLNFSCASCHVGNSGTTLRTEILSPALGHTSHFPVYRSKWGEMGTLHRRFSGCNKQVRAKPFKAQSDEYKALEYFHTYMSNGLEVNGPSQRK